MVASGQKQQINYLIPSIASPTAGNFPLIDASGELSNSDYNYNSFAGYSHSHEEYSKKEYSNYISWQGNEYLNYSSLYITGAAINTRRAACVNFIVKHKDLESVTYLYVNDNLVDTFYGSDQLHEYRTFSAPIELFSNTGENIIRITSDKGDAGYIYQIDAYVVPYQRNIVALLTGNATGLSILSDVNTDVSMYIGDYGSPGYGFHWTYKGTQASNDNELEFWAERQGSPIQVNEVKLDGNTYYYRPLHTTSTYTYLGETEINSTADPQLKIKYNDDNYVGIRANSSSNLYISSPNSGSRVVFNDAEFLYSATSGKMYIGQLSAPMRYVFSDNYIGNRYNVYELLQGKDDYTIPIKNFTVLQGCSVETSPINFRFDQNVLGYAQYKNDYGNADGIHTNFIGGWSGIDNNYKANIFDAYTDSYLNLNSYYDGNPLIVEITGTSFNNTSNGHFWPYFIFHGNNSNCNYLKMEVMNGSGIWETAYEESNNLYYYVAKHSLSVGILKGARWTFSEISGSCYLKNIGVIGRNSSPYAWTLKKDGDDMWGALNMRNNSIYHVASINVSGYSTFGSTIAPDQDNTRYLGSSSKRFHTAYANRISSASSALYLYSAQINHNANIAPTDDLSYTLGNPSYKYSHVYTYGVGNTVGHLNVIGNEIIFKSGDNTNHYFSPSDTYINSDGGGNHNTYFYGSEAGRYLRLYTTDTYSQLVAVNQSLYIDAASGCSAYHRVNSITKLQITEDVIHFRDLTSVNYNDIEIVGIGGLTPTGDLTANLGSTTKRFDTTYTRVVTAVGSPLYIGGPSIFAQASVYPVTDNTYSLGTPSLRWSSLYTNSINSASNGIRIHAGNVRALRADSGLLEIGESGERENLVVVYSDVDESYFSIRSVGDYSELKSYGTSLYYNTDGDYDHIFQIGNTGKLVISSSSVSFQGLDYIDANAARIADVGSPAESTDAANKQYVDNQISSLSGTINDSHIGNSSIHFTEVSIDHDNILNVGDNTHAQIDAHIVNTSNPHSVTPEIIGAANTYFKYGDFHYRPAITGFTQYTSNVTGALCIELPIGYENVMFSFTLAGFQYSVDGTNYEIKIGGYAYSAESVVNRYVLGDALPNNISERVRFGKSANNKVIVLIGDYTDDHDYARWVIKDAYAGAHNLGEDLITGEWSLSYVTGSPFVGAINETNFNKYWSSNNDGAGSLLDADLLDGNQGSYYATASDLSSLSTSFDTVSGEVSSLTGEIEEKIPFHYYERTIDLDPATANNKYYDIGTYNFYSLEGEFIIDILFSGSGGGISARYNIPANYNMDYLSDYGVSFTNNEWHTISPSFQSPRHFLPSFTHFELQAKPNNNLISFRIVIRDSGGETGASLVAKIRIQHSSNFYNSSFTESTATGIDTGVYQNIPQILGGGNGSTIFGMPTYFLQDISGADGEFNNILANEGRFDYVRLYNDPTFSYHAVNKNYVDNYEHGNLVGLSDDDHSQYIYTDPVSNTRNIIDNANAGVGLTILDSVMAGYSSPVFQVTQSPNTVKAYIDGEGNISGNLGIFQKAQSFDMPTASVDVINKLYLDSLNRLSIEDTRSEIIPTSGLSREVQFDFKHKSTLSNSENGIIPSLEGVFAGVMSIAPWSDDSGGPHTQLVFGTLSDKPSINVRCGFYSNGTWGNWHRIAIDSDLNSLSGSLGSSISAVSGDLDTRVQLIEDTNIGLVGNSVKYESQFQSPTGWALKPQGWMGFMDNNLFEYGAPINNFGYFAKLASRDMSNGWGGIWVGYSPGQSYLGRAGSSGVYASWEKLWSDANDGPGSNLNADLLDGQEGSYYASSSNLSALSGSLSTHEGDIDNPHFVTPSQIGAATAESIGNLSGALNTKINYTCPVGTVQMWAGSSSSAPTNWLFCNGQAVSRSTYASLYSAIGDTYGAGDAETTFNVPNFGARVPVGVGSHDNNYTGVTGQTGGRFDTIVPNHDHEISYVESTAGMEGDIIYVLDQEQSFINTVLTSQEEVAVSNPDLSNMQPFLGINFIIYAGE